MNKFKLTMLSSAISAAILVGCGGGGGGDSGSVSGGDSGNSAPQTNEMDVALKMKHPWMHKLLTPEQRAGLLVAALTLDQKQQQLVGSAAGYVVELPKCYGGRHVSGISDLEIPTLRIFNGPVGVGQNDCTDGTTGSATFSATSAKATAVPSGSAVAASFDPSVATEFGNLVGVEANNLALHVWEAPGINMARLPVLGRNFEYFGEDPFLTGTMAVAETVAAQAHGLIAMNKHFVANEQETNRQSVNEIIDDQVLHELYLLPFEMAVKDGQAAAIMCSYNYVNGYSACEGKELLTDVLRNQWGFKGYVQSDFGAAYSTENTLLAGMDHEMSSAKWWTLARLNAALTAGTIRLSDIDTALTRRYTQMFKAGIFDRPLVQTAIDFTAGGTHAYSIGVQGSVLLQNNGALPFASTVKKVVLLGKTTQLYAQQAVAGGSVLGKEMGTVGASSDVIPNYTITPLQGIKNTLTSLGNTTATVQLVLVNDANTTATIDGVAATYAQAIAATTAADAVVIVAGTIAEEGADRATFTDNQSGTLALGSDGKPLVGDNLDWYVPSPKGGTYSGSASNPTGNSQTTKMIKDVMAATSTTAKSMVAKTALVLKDNAGVAMDAALVGATGPAILELWLPGQEDGHIMGDLLFGVKNPSGKLPVTFPVKGSTFMEQATQSMFPGVRAADNNGKTMSTVVYQEKLNIGYRWYDSKSITPAFPFGHGLSYTSFTITNPSLTAPTAGTTTYSVKTTVTNTGAVDGAETVQVYLGIPSKGYAQQPPKRLVGFQKVSVSKGATKEVTVTIDPAATNHPLGIWDEAAQTFVIPSGTFTVYVGNSSGKLTTVGSFTR